MIRNNREYRMVTLPDMQFRAAEGEDYIVEGYATTFDQRYELFNIDGVSYGEVIDRAALNETDMSDVIFVYNHEGMVFARQSNGTLILGINEKGLYIRADLSKTQAAREMYESIKAGNVTQMSWAFTVSAGGDSYDEKTHTRSINKVAKIYDVSAVSIPANPNTDISARSYFDGVIEEERRRDLIRREKVEEIRRILDGNQRNDA